MVFLSIVLFILFLLSLFALGHELGKAIDQYEEEHPHVEKVTEGLSRHEYRRIKREMKREYAKYIHEKRVRASFTSAGYRQ